MTQAPCRFLLVLLAAALPLAGAQGTHEHQAPVPAAPAAAGPGNVLDVPPNDAGAATLAARGEAERASLAKFRVFHDFRFTDRLPESGITFVHQIVDDAGRTYKAA